MTSQPIIVEKTYPARIEKVWRAITEVDQMRQWFFDNIPLFKAEVGFETQFLVQTPNRGFLHIWKITEVVPNQKLVCNWSYESISGNSFVIFELFEEGDETRLKLTAIGLETFPQGIPEFKRESCEAGWEYFLGESLKSFFSK
ncbi:SRPBCC domain-containing protein [Saprospiraceae bacterium]|nr:SRPBCC domain-containing protein [Saprospiraceae bacterium]